MVHTYRDPEVRRSSFLGSAYLRSLVIFCLMTMGLFAVTGFPPPWDAVEVLGGLFALLLVVGYIGHRGVQEHGCGEIRLSDDGTCEFETPRRLIRVHASEIRSVRYSPETDDSRESYTIHYRDGSLDVAKTMTGFADFLSRLKALNPVVDLTSFPDWRDSGGSTPVRLGPFNRFMHSALFPLIVVALLVYLASQTLLGK